MRRSAQLRHSAAGFTLLELMISVALVLVLMLAITKIFSISSDTIGASQGIGAAARDARAAQAVLAHDMGAMATDSPFIWIRYDPPTPAFRSASDAATDHDYQPGVQGASPDPTATAAQQRAKLTIDLDQNGTEGEASVLGESMLPPANLSATASLAVNSRNHRLDRFSFFARDLFNRQTANNGDMLVANQSGPEAWINYGHLTLPQNNGAFVLTDVSGAPTALPTEPGTGSEQNNPQNFYASQWVLGRVAMLMVQPTNYPTGSPQQILSYDSGAGVPQEYYGRATNWANGLDLSPLSANAIATVAGGTPLTGSANVALNKARYDLVGIDIKRAKDVVSAFENEPAVSTPPWYTQVMQSRFQINPFVNKPIDARTAAQQVPAFLSACSQFVVEYAGDFVTQNADGTLDTTAPNHGLQGDGVVDFYCTRDATNNVVSRQTQWFGYPRSVTGSPTVRAGTGDTILLGDFLHYISGAAWGTTAPPVGYPLANYADVYGAAKGNPNFTQCEQIPGSATTVVAASNNKNNVTFADTRSAAGVGTDVVLGTVYAAFGPETINSPTSPRPKMYRITLTIDRPEMTGRTVDGQTFEYVFAAP